MRDPVTNPDIDPRDLIQAELRSGATLTAIAKQINYSRSALSLYIAGKYPSKSTSRVEAAILATFSSVIHCPHLQKALTNAECTVFKTRSMPRQNPDELKHWLSCQRCPYNPPECDDEGGLRHASQ